MYILRDVIVRPFHFMLGRPGLRDMQVCGSSELVDDVSSVDNMSHSM